MLPIGMQRSPSRFCCSLLPCNAGGGDWRWLRVRPKQQDDWYELPNLWGAVIGGPSTMKNPEHQCWHEPLSWLEHDAKEDYEQDMAHFTLQKLEHEHELKLLKSDKAAEKLGSSAVEVQQRMWTLMSKPPGKNHAYVATNPTMPPLKWQELLRDNPRGILLMRDELTGLLNNCNR